MSGQDSTGVFKIGLRPPMSRRAANVASACLKPRYPGRCGLGKILTSDQPSTGFDQTCIWTATGRFCLMDDGAGCHSHAPCMWAAHGQMGT